jgi:DNA-binding transcriptional regulator YdaS (Cro superfamily)
MDNRTRSHILRAVLLFASQAEAARAIGVSQPTVCNWLKGVHGLSPENAARIERATRGVVTRAELLPDVFGDAS